MKPRSSITNGPLPYQVWRTRIVNEVKIHGNRISCYISKLMKLDGLLLCHPIFILFSRALLKPGSIQVCLWLQVANLSIVQLSILSIIITFTAIFNFPINKIHIMVSWIYTKGYKNYALTRISLISDEASVRLFLKHSVWKIKHTGNYFILERHLYLSNELWWPISYI